MRALVYVRQSQDRAGDELGVTRQAEDCTRLASQRGWTIVRTIVDNDISAAGRKRRDGFEALLTAIDAGEADAVVAWSLDRLTRNRRDTVRLIETCENRSTHIALVRGSDLDLSTPAGRLSADILASVSRHEIEQKSDRQLRAVAQAVAQGRRVGGRRPFGFELDMTRRPDEAAAVHWAYDEILAGVSLGAVARGWNERGLHTPQGHRDGTAATWTAQTVGQTLRRASYAGLREHRDKVAGPAAWRPTVDEGTWRAAQAILADPSRRSPGGPTALLTGVALCGVCGRENRHTVHAGGGPTGRGYRIYRCSAALGHISRRAEPIENYVSAVIVARLSRPDVAELMTVGKRPDVAELHREADRLRLRVDALADAYAADEITVQQMTKATRALRDKVAAVEGRMADASRVDLLGPLVSAAHVGTMWESLDTDRQRAVIDLLTEVVIHSAGRGVRRFDSTTVDIQWRTS